MFWHCYTNHYCDAVCAHVTSSTRNSSSLLVCYGDLLYPLHMLMLAPWVSAVAKALYFFVELLYASPCCCYCFSLPTHCPKWWRYPRNELFETICKISIWATVGITKVCMVRFLIALGNSMYSFCLPYCVLIYLTLPFDLLQLQPVSDAAIPTTSVMQCVHMWPLPPETHHLC